MLTSTELPGFPPPDFRPRCIGCMELIFPTDADWTSYAEGELEAWERDLPTRGVPADHVFRDSHDRTGNHTPTCPYADLPPIALWQRDITIANRVRRRLWEARQQDRP